jgi:hypothetical protein
MNHTTAFLKAMEREGIVPHAALHILALLTARLEQWNYRATSTFYVYRTGKRLADDLRGKRESSRQLLVFASPDSALAFAQRHKLKPPPQLAPIYLTQLLVVLVKFSSIRKIVFLEEDTTLVPDARTPDLLAIQRSEVLALVQKFELS